VRRGPDAGSFSPPEALECQPRRFRLSEGGPSDPPLALRSSPASHPRPEAQGSMAKYRYDEDLFKDTTMTFGEHLEELRGALWRALAGLIVGMAIGLVVGKQAVEFIEEPLASALRRYYLQRARSSLVESQTHMTIDEEERIATGRLLFDDYLFDPQSTWWQLRQYFGTTLPDLPEMPLFRPAEIERPAELAASLAAAADGAEDTPAARLWRAMTDHQRQETRRIAHDKDNGDAAKKRLAELLSQLAKDPELLANVKPDQHWPDATVQWNERLSQAAGDEQRAALQRDLLLRAFPRALAAQAAPLAKLRLWRSVDDDPRTRIQSLSVTEPFMIYLKASLVVGATLAAPWIFWQIWAFVAAGLYPHEKRYVYLFGPVSLGLFLLGVATAFLFVFQPVLDYLFLFNDWLGIDPDPRINEWLSFVLFLPLGFGISFQLPLVMLFLERIGIFTIENYVGNWRIAVITIVVLSAVLTPADPWSMFFMAVPLVFLYGLGLVMCRYLPRASEE
jgi:sec-independent protein translocase protein TatC